MFECVNCHKTEHDGSEDHQFDIGQFGRAKINAQIQNDPNKVWDLNTTLPDNLVEYSKKDAENILRMFRGNMEQSDPLSVALDHLPGEIAETLKRIFDTPEAREQFAHRDYVVEVEQAEQDRRVYQNPFNDVVQLEFTHKHRIRLRLRTEREKRAMQIADAAEDMEANKIVSTCPACGYSNGNHTQDCVIEQAREDVGSVEDVRRKFNDPNHTWLI